MPVATSASPDNIDLSLVSRTVQRSLVWLLPLSILAGSITHFAVSAMAPRFQSEAQLSVSARGQPNPFSDPARDSGGGDVAVRMDKEAINTHISAIMSGGLAEQIATELKLAERPEFNSAVGSVDSWSAFWRRWGFGGPRSNETDMERVLAVFSRQLEVYSPKESRTINVRFTSVDPDLAARVANRLVETYRIDLAAQAVGETGQVLLSLGPEIDKLARDVAHAERDAQQFRGKANIFGIGQQATGLNEQQLAELSAELSRTKAVRGDAEARLISARDLAKANAADSLPDVQKSPLIQSLIQSRVRVERQVAELSATLLPGHPRMRQLVADLDGLKRQIAVETKKIVDGIEKEVTVARLREAGLVRNLDEVKTQIVRQSPDEVTLRQLDAAAKSKRSELERLQAQFEANKVRATSRAIPIETQIMTVARPSATVVFPKKVPATLAVALAALFAGLAIVLTRALVSGSRASMPAAERRVEPALATIATVGIANGVNATAAPSALGADAAGTPSRSLAERSPPALASVALHSIVGLARRIETRAHGGHGLRVIMSCADESRDAIAESLDLADKLAGRGRSALVIDWRAPGQRGCASAVGLPEMPGLTEIINGNATFDDVVHPIPRQRGHLLTGGSLVGPDYIFDRNGTNITLDALDEAYDYLVVTGSQKALRALFEAVEGRFDVAVDVGGAASGDGRYLGFEVFDIDVYRLDKASGVRAIGREPKVRPVFRPEPVSA